MLNLLKAEFYKLKTSKLFYLITAVMASQSAVCLLMSDSLKLKTGNYMLTFALYTQQFLLLIPAIAAFSYFVVCEFNTGFVKNLLAYGHKRSNVVLSKSIAFYTGSIVITFVFPIIIALTAVILNGYGEAFTFQSLLFILRTSALMALVYTAFASLAVFIAFATRNVVVTIGLYMTLDTVSRFGQFFSARMKLVKILYEKTVFAQSYIAVQETIAYSQVIQVVLVSLITIAVSTLGAVYFFKRASIK